MNEKHFTRVKYIKDVAVPEVGFGTWQLKARECCDNVETALQEGYRHIDTARIYGNEVEVGNGIKLSGVTRDKIFLTSKVWYQDLAPNAVEREVNASLNDIKTDYLDLVLIHWPNPDQPLEKTLDALSNLQQEGKIRHFGVCNFTLQWIGEALEFSRIFCNQIEMHVMLRQKAMCEFAQENDILITAYSPLACGEITLPPLLSQIADKHAKTPQQVAIRWLIEQPNVVAIPRSAKTHHIKENIDIYDFSLDEDDYRKISQLPDGKRQIYPEFAPDWNY